MPKQRKGELIKARNFSWILKRRGKAFYADGRSNSPSPGRHSLGTGDRTEAINQVHELDQTCARRLGLEKSDGHGAAPLASISIADGRRLFEAHIARPRVLKGGSPKTQSRYRAVLDKFVLFLARNGIEHWEQVKVQVVESYASFLQKDGLRDKTIYLEITVIKQVIKWLVGQDLLAKSSSIKLQMRKPDGIRGYCWQPEEVSAMLSHCLASKLEWLHDLLLALACTGCRISELLQMRWSDVDLERNTLRVVDESQTSIKGDRKPRTTKNQQSRMLPLHDDLRQVLDSRRKLPSDRVFSSKQYGKLKYDKIRTVFINKVIEPLARRFPSKEGELGFKDGRFHAFRHYFCSVCANSSVPELTLKEWMGHKDSDMIRHYYHLHDAESKRQMGRVKFLKLPARNGADGSSVVEGGVRAPETVDRREKGGGSPSQLSS